MASTSKVCAGGRGEDVDAGVCAPGHVRLSKREARLIKNHAVAFLSQQKKREGSKTRKCELAGVLYILH